MISKLARHEVGPFRFWCGFPWWVRNEKTEAALTSAYVILTETGQLFYQIFRSAVSIKHDNRCFFAMGMVALYPTIGSMLKACCGLSRFARRRIDWTLVPANWFPRPAPHRFRVRRPASNAPRGLGALSARGLRIHVSPTFLRNYQKKQAACCFFAHRLLE